MIIRYKYGFLISGILYVWKEGKLFRAAQMINKRFYPFKELPLIDVGNNKGYLVAKKRKSLKQLKDMTIFVNYERQEINSSDCPF